MSFKKVALALISATYFASHMAAAAPASQDAGKAVAEPELIFEGPFPIANTTLSQRDESGEPALAKRANCYGGGAINTQDIENLGNQLQSKGGNNYVPKTSYVSYTLGSTKVCILNNYLFDNTHVSDWEAGWGTLAVRNDCCYTPYCGGGLQQGHGDSGLAVNIVVKSAGQGC
ncbi:hypothetical protein F4802DRAFT_572724 [Xylaria palmicola]|nr:hypothetical protein F4802DRAFT_572724 [Xylaria palmicola]